MKFGTWFKSNWPIVALGLVAVAALPTLWYFSSAKNRQIVEGFQKRVQQDYSSVTNANNAYKIVSPTGEEILATSAPVNAQRTAAYRTIGEQLQAQTSQVSQKATALNTNDGKHKPLIEGLFPQPSELEKLARPKFFVRTLLDEARPALLKIMNAGSPPPAAEIAQQLAEYVQGKRDTLRQESGRTEFDAAEQEALAKELLALRIGRVQQRAAEIQVYADTSVFDTIPAEALDKTASLAEVWDWQERHWVHTDLARAIAAANGDSGGRGVPGSVIKRLLRVWIEDPPYRALGREGGAAAPAAFEAGADRVPTNFLWSITGRASGPGSNNKWYDIRYVTVDAIVDSARLPAFLDALASTNFMTVIDVDLESIQPAEHLAQGFSYGDSPVVKATFQIETVWFREWREPWMPAEVKAALGLDPNASTEAATAPASRSRGAEESELGGGRSRRRGGGG